MPALRFGFSWLGLVLFALPMLINIVYFVKKPANAPEESVCPYRWVEMIEQATRVLYVIALCILVSDRKIVLQSPWPILAMVFLVLYYIVWIRYFAGGRKVSLMEKSFLFVPIPLAVFPVLYYLFAAIWLHNYIAAVVMIVFGVAHYVVSYLSFHS